MIPTDFQNFAQVDLCVLVTIPLLVAGAIISYVIDIERGRYAEYARIMDLPMDERIVESYKIMREAKGCTENQGFNALTGKCENIGPVGSACKPPAVPTGFKNFAGYWRCEDGPSGPEFRRCVIEMEKKLAKAAGLGSHMGFQFTKKAEEICRKRIFERPDPPPPPDTPPFYDCVSKFMAQGLSFNQAVLICSPRSVTILASPRAQSCILMLMLKGYSKQAAKIKCLQGIIKEYKDWTLSKEPIGPPTPPPGGRGSVLRTFVKTFVGGGLAPPPLPPPPSVSVGKPGAPISKTPVGFPTIFTAPVSPAGTKAAQQARDIPVVSRTFAQPGQPIGFFANLANAWQMTPQPDHNITASPSIRTRI